MGSKPALFMHCARGKEACYNFLYFVEVLVIEMHSARKTGTFKLIRVFEV